MVAQQEQVQPLAVVLRRAQIQIRNLDIRVVVVRMFISTSGQLLLLLMMRVNPVSRRLGWRRSERDGRRAVPFTST